MKREEIEQIEQLFESTKLDLSNELNLVKREMRYMTGRLAEVLFYEEEKHECDMCDNVSDCVVIGTLGDDCLNICKECLEKIIEGFDK